MGRIRVKLKYDDNRLSCDKILAKFSQNYAILSGNLIFKNLITNFYADQMEVDLIARTTKTTMFNKDNKITNGELLSFMDEKISVQASTLGREQNPSLTGDPDRVLVRFN